MAQLSTKLPWELAQTRWAATINPVLALPILNGNLITDVALKTNTPLAINHLLGRSPIGWILTDNTADAVIFRSAAFNQFTLTLEANTNTTISLWIF